LSAQAAVYAGTDLIGMIFAESKRQISTSEAKLIRSLIPHGSFEASKFQTNVIDNAWILKQYMNKGMTGFVGVFMNQSVSYINAVCEEVGLDFVQLHGSEPQDFIDQIHRPVIHVIHVDGNCCIENLIEAALRVRNVAAILLDTKTSSGSGGTGMTFDWSLAARLDSLGVSCLDFLF